MEIKSTTGLEEKLMDMDVPVVWTSHVQVIEIQAQNFSKIIN